MAPRLFLLIVWLLAIFGGAERMERPVAVIMLVDLGLFMLRRHFWPPFEGGVPNPNDPLRRVHAAVLLVAALGFLGWLCVEILTPPL
jgi:hypothetical protein